MKQDEFSPLPREYRDNPPELAPPGPEFADHAPRFPEKSKKKHLPVIAAALLLALLVLPKAAPTPAVPEPTDIIPSSAPLETQPIVTQPTQPLLSEPDPTEPLLSEPQPTETVPLETELSGPPTCQPIFFAFSDALRARLVFTNPDAILSVRAELWDSLGETLEQAWEVPQEAIGQGEYNLPGMMGMYDMYMAHHESYDPADPFPVPQLRITMTYLDGETETTTELTQSYTEEQGWSVRAVDGEIRFRTYEAYAPISLRAGDDAWNPETLESGELLVVVRINGETVPPAQCLISQDEQVWPTVDGESITFYYSSLTTPQQGESGEVLVTVYQKLQGYDAIWSEAVELAY